MTLHLERNAPSHATGPSCTEATVHRTTDGKTPTGFHHAAIDSKPDDQPCSFEKRRAPVVIHTLPVAAIGILTGITLQDRFAETCLVATLICPILFILTGASALATPNWRPNTRLSPRLSTVAIFCGFLMLGSLRMHVTQISSLPVDWKRLVAEHPSLMRVECTVLTLPRRFAANHDKEQLQPKASDRSTFLCDVDSIVTGDGPVPASGRMRLSVPSLQPDLEPGDRIAATLRPRPIRAPTNPGQFDQRKAATRIGVVARASCVYASQIQRLSSRTLPRVSLHRYREHARRTLLRGISDTDTSGLVTTMILGDRTGLSDEISRVFRQSGTAHFLAVSGLHLTIPLSFVLLLTRLFGLSTRCQALSTGATLVLFVTLAEPRPPILRAGVMAGIAIIGWSLGRRYQSTQGLAFAAIILLIAQPTTCFSPAFQFSFIAVLSIVLLPQPLRQAALSMRRVIEYHVLRNRVADADRQLRRAICRIDPSQLTAWERSANARRILGHAWLVSFSATLGCTPLMTHYFGVWSPIAPVASICLSPFVYLFVLIGLVKLATWHVLPVASPLLAATQEATTWPLIKVAQLASTIPMAQLSVPKNSPMLVIACYASLLAFAWTFQHGREQNDTSADQRKNHNGDIAGRLKRTPTTWHRRCSRRLAIPASLSVLVLFSVIVRPSNRTPPPGLRVTMLDVGAGTATVIEYPDGTVALYDCGSSSARVGRSVILPFLSSRHIAMIDKIYLSHANVDHFNGLPSLIARVPCRQLNLNESFHKFTETNAASKQILQIVTKRNIPIRTMVGQSVTEYVGECAVTHWWARDNTAQSTSANDLSTVIRLEYGGVSILLTGDIETTGMTQMMKAESRRSDILFLPHHGSKEPVSERFIRHVDPTVLVCSSDRRIRQMGWDIRRFPTVQSMRNTADHGVIVIEVMNDGTWQITSPCSAAPKLTGTARPDHSTRSAP